MNNNQARRELWLRRVRKALHRNNMGLFVNREGCPNLKNKDLQYLIQQGLVVRKQYVRHERSTWVYLAPADGIPQAGDTVCPDCKRRVDLFYGLTYPNFESPEKFHHALDCGVRDDHWWDWQRNPRR